MPWRTESMMNQRVEFVLRAKRREKTISDLCREYEISRPTGYLWLRRYEEAGEIQALAERSRRPHRSPGRTERAKEEVVLRLRDEKGWGARKLAHILEARGVEIEPWTVHRILKREGRVIANGKERQATKRFERSQCNELAQMDFKGEYTLKNAAKCYPLSFLDDCSRYLHGLWPLKSPGGKEVQRSLEGHFRAEGVPQAILTDHGTPWFSMSNHYGLTWVAVWLIKQGVVLKFSGIGHPQTQGKVERFHRTLKARTKHRGEPATMDEWLRWAEEFRREYNQERPHEALADHPPTHYYHASDRPYPARLPTIEYPAALATRRVDVNGLIKWRTHEIRLTSNLVGQRVGFIPLDDDAWSICYGPLILGQFELPSAHFTATVYWDESFDCHPG